MKQTQKRAPKSKDIPNRISASLVTEAMKGLLKARFEKKVSRMTFLRTWTRLRRILSTTDEYVRWRWEVKERAGGACERCGEVGNEAHHIEPIAFNPDRALDTANGEYTCRRCHRAHHREERARRRSQAGQPGGAQHSLPDQTPSAPALRPRPHSPIRPRAPR